MRCSLALTFTVLLTLVSGSIDSFGADFCVDNASDLQGALSTAAGNGENDVIMVVQGNYSENFYYYSVQGYGLTLLGGYAAGCTARVVDASNCLLDGSGGERVLSFYDVNGGDCTVDGFTLQNGNGNFDGAGVYAESYSESGTAGDITLRNNIVRTNTSQQGGGGIYARSGTKDGTAGNVVLVNNVISGNSAGVGGGVFASSYTTQGIPGTVTATNNTITGNTASVYGGGAFLYAYSNTVPGGILDCYNNIIWGNTGPRGADMDIRDDINSTLNGYNNVVSDVNGTWTNSGDNRDADPLFVDAAGGDYHILKTSPCRDAGLATAPQVPKKDFEGQLRVKVDIGADEYLQAGLPGIPLLLLD
jgi:hypothetical protein